MSNWFDRLIGKKTYDANDALSVIWSEMFGTGSKKVNSVKQAVEQSPAMTYVTNLAGKIENVNNKVTQLTGYSREELIGENPRIFSSGNKSKEEYKILWETISSGKEWRGEFLNRKKNGEPYWVSGCSN